MLGRSLVCEAACPRVGRTRAARGARILYRHQPGARHFMQHDHWLEESQGRTVMRDRFEFVAPLGPLGCVVEKLFLTAYMRRFLLERNAILKRTAESDEWRQYLP